MEWHVRTQGALGRNVTHSNHIIENIECRWFLGASCLCLSVSQCGKWKHSIRGSRDPPRFPLTSARKEQTIKGTHTLLMCPQEHSVNRAPGQQSQCLQRPEAVTSFVLTPLLLSFSLFEGAEPAIRKSKKNFIKSFLVYIDHFGRRKQCCSRRTYCFSFQHCLNKFKPRENW